MTKTLIDVVPSNPASNWRYSGSGPSSVKWATGRANVGNQASYGNSETGMNINIWNTIKIGTWNVRGLIEIGKLAIVEKETCGYPIVGLSETHWKGSGHFRTKNNNVIYYAGCEKESRNGVAVMINSKLTQCVKEYKAVNDRTIMVKLQAKPTNLNIIQVYLPTSDADDDEVELYYSQLEELLNTIPKREITMIIGDFNAKVGRETEDHELHCAIGKYGLGDRNDRGERLILFCIENNFFITNTGFQQHPRRLYTWTSPVGKYRNQIDYVLINSRWRTSIKNVKTFPGKDCHSDHQFLAAELRMKLSEPKTRKPLQNWWHMKTNEQYNKLATQKISHINTETHANNTANSLWNETKTALIDAATQAGKDLKRQPTKSWISEETWKQIEARKIIKTKGLNSDDDKEQYKKLSIDIKQRCKRDKNNYLNGICQEIEQHSHKNETRDVYTKIKQITRTFTPKYAAIRSEEGTLLTDSKQIKDRWKTYCEKLLRNENNAEYQQMKIDYDEKEPDIIREEVVSAFNKLKHHKSPGSDGIVSEMLTELGDTGVDIFHKICQRIWENDIWPEDWTTSIYVPIHKKGSKDICENYRTIALISHASKVMLQILSERIKPYILSQLPLEQAGFVPGRGTREQILNINQIIEKAREFNIPTYLCFIDYTKAFDCVRWQNMWPILDEMGIPRHLIAILKNLYDHNSAHVRLESGLTDPFQVGQGVRQGCILSPLLFNIYGEWIMRKALDEWNGGITFNGRKISNLRYTDDTTLIASSEEELIELFQRIENTSEEVGLKINKKKTKVMIVDRQNNNRLEIKAVNSIKTVDNFIYLGALISNRGGSSQEIRRRSALAKEAMTKLTTIWKSHQITLNTKMNLVKSLVISIFLYGAECWTLKESDKKKIDAFEMHCWRRMLRIPWTERRTNQSILDQLKIKKRLRTIVAEKVAKFFGHVIRRDGLERLTIEGAVIGKRSRGRSPTRYTDLITKITGTNITQSIREAESRDLWRNRTNNIP